MNVSVKLVRNDLAASVARHAREMGKTIAESGLLAARGAVRRVIAITPPSFGGTTGAAAYRQGRKRIDSDMRRVLVPVRLKGKRRITTVFGNRLRTPITVPTRELHPDVAGVYRQNRTFRNSGVGVRARNLGDRKYWVDQSKFTAVLRAKEARVGRLASGWVAGAMALDVPVQQWISRHGGANGRVVMRNTGTTFSILVQNFAENAAPNVRAELARRVPYAVQYQAAAMERAIRGYKQRVARR